MLVFKLNTHHTYLNQLPKLFPLYPNKEIRISVNDTIGQEVFQYVGVSDNVSLNLPAGEFVVKAQYDGEDNDIQEECVIIEDAIKFGGGAAKKAYVFEKSPWVFVTSGDRLYIWNRETKESKIEYSLSPDTIFLCQNQSRYYVFKTMSDYSIFDVEKGQILFSYTNHIFANDHIVIYGTNGEIHIYDYIEKCEILLINEQYLITERLFYIEESKLKSLDLTNGEINVVPNIEDLSGKSYLLSNHSLLVLARDARVKEYHLYDLGNKDEQKSCFYFYSSYYIACVGKVETQESRKVRDELSKANNILRQLNIEQQNILFSANVKSYQIVEYKTLYNNQKEIELSVKESMFSIPQGDNQERYLRAIVKIDELKDISNVAAEYEYIEPINNKKVFSPNDTYGKYICNSEEMNWAIYQSDKGLVLHNVKEDKTDFILQDVYMPCLYKNAYFSSDGKSVVMVKGKGSIICNFEDLSESAFNIEGFVIDRQDGFNGYSPEIEIFLSTMAQPRWRDPISLNYVRPEDMSGHIFKSPKGDFEAKIDFLTRRMSRITGKELSWEEYSELEKRYAFRNDSSMEEKMKIEIRRQKLIEQYGGEIILSKKKDFWQREINLQENLSSEEKNKRLENVMRLELNNFLHKTSSIISWITDEIGFVEYRHIQSGKESKILIGSDVWFLNYVSFSQDSQYLAFGAKMKESEFRSQQSGVFVLYDLKNECDILRFNDNSSPDNGRSLSAIWTTMFNSRNECAFYDSTPNSFIVHHSDGQFSTELVKERSLLCFSPSGQYIAFSNQKYIDHQHHPDHWGHQPSGNIFIHKVNDAQRTLFEFNDFPGENNSINGVCQRKGNVASAAFSQDERRLLAVGTDGSVVVRNLHIN